MFTARQFDGDEALRMGLINRLVALADLEATARSYADVIGANAPLTIKAAKMAINDAVRDSDRHNIDKVEAAVDACFASADFKEGRTAFMQKRTPKFQGK